MAEPPPKRTRRTDSSSMWDETDRGRSTPPRSDRAPDEENRKIDRRSRSRSRDRNDWKQDRSRYRDGIGRDNRDSRHRRGRERSLSRERRRGWRDDIRTRSRSPVRERTRDATRQRSPPRAPRGAQKDRPRNGADRPNNASLQHNARGAPGNSQVPNNVDDESRNGGGDDVEAQMRNMMGFSAFKSTKNTKVPGNDKLYAVRKDKKTEYRQYMNRTGGFNRPLSPSR